MSRILSVVFRRACDAQQRTQQRDEPWPRAHSTGPGAQGTLGPKPTFPSPAEDPRVGRKGERKGEKGEEEDRPVKEEFLYGKNGELFSSPLGWLQVCGLLMQSSLSI